MHYFRLVGGLRGFARPGVRAALQNLLQVAEEAERMAAHNADFAQRVTALGYPRDAGGNTVSPYDFVADYFRGARGMMTDLYRKKEQLLQLLERARVWLTRLTIDNAQAAGHPVVMIPIHWAPDAFMSDKQFKEFYWPTLRQMMLDMIAAGLIPMPLWEADCSKRLEVIRDVPPGKCIYWFERTDMVRAREVLGDVVALRGNLSPSLMTTGTPAEVDAAVRHLAENVFHKGGRLILDCAFGLPDETSLENVRAMFAAARRYGG
jgi:uroporphyrinogen-III decarboxylase